jgi:hypothetical protein
MLPPARTSETSVHNKLRTRQNIPEDSELQVKVKLYCYYHAGDKVERKYSPYSFLTLALDGSDQRPGRLVRKFSSSKT